MLYTAKVVWVNGLNLKKLKTNKMELKQAIGILETHNRWRRGEDVEPMIDPRELGIAIDLIVEYIKKNGVLFF